MNPQVFYTMQQQEEHFLNLTNYPARLTAEQAGWFLGFTQPEITILMGEGILKPLGRPARNGPKYFSTMELEELRRDRKWLTKASDAIVSYWHNKNARKSTSHSSANLVEMVQSK